MAFMQGTHSLSHFSMTLLTSLHSYDSAMIGALYSSGVYYYFYELFNRKLMRYSGEKQLSTISNILSAAFAGSLTAIFSNPLWVINTRTSVEKNVENRQGVWKTLMKIVTEDGIASLWAGVLPSLILVINPLIQYVLFERVKILLSKRRTLSGLDVFLIAALTKLTASFLTYPYLLVRTKLQVKQKLGAPNEEYKNMWDCIQKIYFTDGLSGFYKGLSLKLLHSVITTAILFLIKEESVAYVNKIFLLLGLSKKRMSKM